MKTVLACAILGAWVLPCMAAETFTDIYNFGSDGILWDVESNSWKDNSSVSWTHYTQGFDSSTQIAQATLTIKGHGIDNVWWDRDRDGGYEQMDFVTVSFMGQTLGQLQGNTTTFNLPPSLITNEMGANAEITFQNDLYDKGDHMIDFDWHDAVWLDESFLEVFPNTVSTASPIVPVTAVPAPGALILAGIGTIIVGTLRRRKAI